MTLGNYFKLQVVEGVLGKVRDELGLDCRFFRTLLAHCCKEANGFVLNNTAKDKDDTALFARPADGGVWHAFLCPTKPTLERNGNLPWKELHPLGPGARLLSRACKDAEAAGAVEVEEVEAAMLARSTGRVAFLTTVFRLKCFLRHFAKGYHTLPSVGIVSKELHEYAFEEAAKTYRGGEVLRMLEDFFGILTTKEMEEDRKKVAGTILHGPPGTGKTYLMQILSEMMGLAQYIAPVSVGELEVGGCVGDAAKAIKAVMERALAFPYLPCFLLIDECDTLMKSRLGAQDSNSESKATLMGVFLTLFKGGRDVPNLYFMGTTNMFSSIDPAFLRRFGSSDFVGCPSPSEREQWLNPFYLNLPKEDNDRRMQELVLKALTNNFSGDAIVKLLRLYDVSQEQWPVQSFPTKLLTATEKEGAQIYFGAECAPALLSRVKGDTSRFADTIKLAEALAEQRASVNSPFASTGGMLVDIWSGMLEVAVRSGSTSLKLPVRGTCLSSSREAIDSALAGCLLYCAAADIDRCELVNSAALALQGVRSSSDVPSALHGHFKRLQQYPRSLLIIDVDSLVDLKYSTSHSSQEPETFGCCFQLLLKATWNNDVALVCTKVGTAHVLSRKCRWQLDESHPRKKVMRVRRCSRCHSKYSDYDQMLDGYACQYHGCEVVDEQDQQVRGAALRQGQRNGNLRYRCDNSFYGSGGGGGCMFGKHSAQTK